MRAERLGSYSMDRHRRRNACLVALEVDNAQLALVAAAAMPDGQIAMVAATAGLHLRLGEWLVRPVRRQLVIDQRRLKTQRRSNRSICLDRHSSSLLPGRYRKSACSGRQRFVSPSGCSRDHQNRSRPVIALSRAGRLNVLGVLGHFFARLEPHVGLLPVGTVAGKLAPAAFLALRKLPYARRRP